MEKLRLVEAGRGAWHVQLALSGNQKQGLHLPSQAAWSLNLWDCVYDTLASPATPGSCRESQALPSSVPVSPAAACSGAAEGGPAKVRGPSTASCLTPWTSLPVQLEA